MGAAQLLGNLHNARIRFWGALHVVDEYVVRQHEVPRLVDPRTAAAITEGVADDGQVFARFLDAHHARAVGTIDRIASDDRVPAILGEKTGSHP